MLVGSDATYVLCRVRACEQTDSYCVLPVKCQPPMTISSSLVASGLAVWLCGVGWRAAHGPGAQSTCQPAVEREDHRNHETCPRTRNPQRKRAVSWAKLTSTFTVRTRP